MLSVINADLAICQIYARELGEGNYWCSTSTMYRIASEAGQNRERRRLATHPPKVKPELLADGHSQVWSWGITTTRTIEERLVSLVRPDRHLLPVHPSWIVSSHESAELAEQFIAEVIECNGATPRTVHADRGVSMTFGLVSELLTFLGVVRSHSRPRIANVNPFSEAQFKTLRYLQDVPKSFATLDSARTLLEGFFDEYNHTHHHFGTKWHTPASVHFGTAEAIGEARRINLTDAFHAHPARFSSRPTPPAIPHVVHINGPALEPQINWPLCVSLDLIHSGRRQSERGHHFVEVTPERAG